MEPLSSPDIDRQVNLLVLEHPVSVVGVQAGIADTALDHFEVQFQLVPSGQDGLRTARSEEHTSALQSLMRISYAVFCLKNQKHLPRQNTYTHVHQRTQYITHNQSYTTNNN